MIKFSCMHCGQPLEADDVWSSYNIDCPSCGQSIVVSAPVGETPAESLANSGPYDPPAVEIASSPDAQEFQGSAPEQRPSGLSTPKAFGTSAQRQVRVASTPLDRPKPGLQLSPGNRPALKKSRGLGKWKYLFSLAILVGGGFYFVKYHGDGLPSWLWQSVADNPRQPVSPTPALTPSPPPARTPSLVIASPAQPVSANTTVPVVVPSTALSPDPLVWMLDHRERWPREVVLLAPTEFPAVFDGRVVGSTTAPAGSAVQTIEIGRDQMKVGYLGGEKTISISSTNLLEVAASELAKPTPRAEPRPAPAAEPTQTPVPAPTPSPEEAGAETQFAPSPSKSAEPRVYVGSAYRPALTDMAKKPDEWKKVREHAGFHEHPVGWQPAYANWGLGRDLLLAFRNHHFTAEEDIGGLTHGINGTTWEKTVVEQGRRYGQQWRCVAITVNFTLEALINDPAKAAQDLKRYCAQASIERIPYYLLFSPVSPEAMKLYDKLRQPYENKPLWVWVAQHAGAAGVALDFPAGFISDPMCRARGVEIYRSTRLAGLKFIWMFNGDTDTAVTEKGALMLRGSGVRPDYWIVSQFENPNGVGTPENKAGTVTSQARVLIDGQF